MTIIPSGLNIIVEPCHGGRSLDPCARLRSGGTVVKVVIDSGGRLASFSLRFVQRDKAAGPCIHDVIRKNIVRHVPLHLEFTGPCSQSVVVERVVDHCAVIGTSPFRRITSNGNTRGMAVIDKVTPRSDVAGGAVLVLTRQLDSKVHIMNDVLFDKDPGAAIHVNAIGRFIVAVCRIAARCNVVNQIAADYPVASLVNGRVGCGALETDDVDSDVVVVVDNIVRDAEVCDVPVHHQRLARTGLEVMHLVAVNDQVSDRSLGVGTIHGNAKPVGTVSRSITPLKILLNVMDVVLQKFYMGASPDYVDTQRGELMFGGAEVANLKTLDSHITLVANGKYAVSFIGSEMRRLQDRCFVRIASKSDETNACVAGCVDAHQLFVDSTPNVDGTARPRGVRGVLNGAPRRRLRAGIGIIPGRRHVEGGVWLAKRSGDTSKEYKEGWNFHVYHLYASTPTADQVCNCGAGSMRHRN